MNRISIISEVSRTLQMFFVVFVVTLIGCERVDAEKEILSLKSPVTFIDQYESLMSSAEIASKLRMPIAEVRSLIQPAASERSRSHSQFNQEWFEVNKGVALLGFSGKVRFELFNDRLARLVFFPDDIDGFMVKGLKAKPATDGVVPTSVPSLRIATGSSHVVWMDQRMMSILQKMD